MKNKRITVLILSLAFSIGAYATSDDNLMEAATNGNVAGAEAALAKGANVDIQDRYGWTALMNAAYQGHEGVVRLLLDRRANVDIQSSHGWTALMNAAYQGHEGVADLLINRSKLSEQLAKQADDRNLSELAKEIRNNIIDESNFIFLAKALQKSGKSGLRNFPCEGLKGYIAKISKDEYKKHPQDIIT